MRAGSATLTVRGRCLLAAGLAAGACAVLLDERDLLRVAVFAGLLPLVVLLFRPRRTRLAAHRRLLPSRVPAGGDTVVTLEPAARTGPGRGEWTVEDAVPAELGASPVFALPARADAGGGGGAAQYRLTPRVRGIYPVGPLITRRADPLGLTEVSHELASPSRLVVTPPVVGLVGLPRGLGTGAGDGDGAARRAAAGAAGGQPPDDGGLRDYRDGDDLRRIAWRATARHGELLVRMDQPGPAGGVQVVLDHRDAAHDGEWPDTSLEHGVCLTASVCAHLQRHGRRVRCATVDGQTLPSGAAGSAGTAGTALLDALAGLAPTGTTRPGPGPATGDDLIAVLGALSGADAGRLVAARPRGTRNAAILLDVAAWAPADGAPVGVDTAAADPRAADPRPADPRPADPRPAERVLARAGWSVLVVGPDDPLPTVWSRLCAGPHVPVGAW